MNGLGFMIWQLGNMPAPAVLADLLVEGRVSWVTIKTLEGAQLYNAKGGNQKLLKDYWGALKGRGIEVGAWQYVYGEQPGPEGDAAANFIEEFDPAFFMIDAEGEYKRYGATKAAKVYCAKLKVKKLEVFLCSYRYPSLHGGVIKPFPFSAFLSAESVDGVAPQVYWIGSHNPAEQVQRSMSEYQKITSKPLVPIGSCFKSGTWEPTKSELAEFRDWCERGFPAYGWYSLDYILKNKHWDWWSTITDAAPPAPPPPEISDHEKITRLWQFAQEQGWDV